MTRVVELRSDTFTRPTEEMRRAMYDAEVGDDVWGEDPTVARLQQHAAELTGKEAALFVTSGTQGNLLGLLGHTRPGQEVILGDQSHIFNAEAGGAAMVGGLQVRTLPNDARGRLEPKAVQSAIHDGSDDHYAPTGALALENTHGACGGAVLAPADIAGVADVAHRAGISVHLDGARLFNAAVALRVPAAEVAETVDSVTFCLSKGLGAPVGSLLCGTREFISRAAHFRKMLGGGMRQVGVLAAAGLVALQNIDRLEVDHANAHRLAEGLAAIPGIAIDVERVESNLLYFDISGTGMEPADFVSRLWAEGVHLAGHSIVFRAVTSYEVDAADIDYALGVISRTVTPLSVGV
ncbi:MAG TPA: GntG family PLP-dependent aldolase [Chloroflexota bacterium]|nr:GntG family PLP-dependent aldolase [Chloroflexota bacterium]